MKKINIIKKILSIILLISCLILLCFFINENKRKASGALEDEYMKFPNFDPNQPKGTDKNPFIILEIVPHRSIGQIGYAVGGQEPVELSAIQAANKWGQVRGVAQDSFVIDRDGPYDYKNVDMFRNNILRVEGGYHIRVVTITPDKLNENVSKFSKYYDLSDGGRNNKLIVGADNDSEIDLIANSDLISISPMAHAGSPIRDLWYAYGRDKSGASYEKSSFKDNGNDLSWQTTMELFMKIGMVEDKSPLIFDYRIMTTGDISYYIDNARAINFTNERGRAYSSNIYKLCLMLKQYNPELLFDMYLNPGHVIGGARIVEGYDNGRSTGTIILLDNNNNPKPESQQLPIESRIFWGEHTLLPKNPFGPPLANVGSSQEYQQYLNDNDIIFSHVAGSHQYHDAVIRNIYHYNGGSSVVQHFNNPDRDDLCVKDDKDGGGYTFNKEFFDWLEEERYKGVRPNKATPMEAIDYVLNFNRRLSRDIRILELEPCNDFSLTPESIKYMIPELKGNIIIDRQTTAEFIGKLDDLNSTYDMIYIGANTGTMNRDNAGNTVYNDPALDGLIYLHVGDRMLAYDALNGAMKDHSGNIIKARDQILGERGQIMKGLSTGAGRELDISTDSIDFYRFSGNDITKLKYQKLKEYAATGYPILFDERLLDNHNRILIDRNLVDDSSYIYRFLQEGINKVNSNVIPTSALTENSSWIKNLLEMEKLSITMIEAPMDYTGDVSSRIAGRRLSFKFQINKPAYSDESTRYDWAIYVDNNADGKYSSDERLRYGTNVSYSTDILVSQNLPKEDYADVIPWILKVRESGNNAVRTQVEGMAAFRQMDDSSRTRINILQITSDDSTIHLENLLSPSPGRTTLFYEYTKDLKDFTLVVKTIKVSEFLNMYNPNSPYFGTVFDTYNPHGTSKFISTFNGERKYYDMLILGFGDCYTDINNRYGALDDITHYIETGRSVMFTHDTTSFVNMEESKFTPVSYGLQFWGYGINQYFRNTLGLDRYGVMKKEGDLTSYDITSMPTQARDIYRGSNKYPERQGLSYPVLMAYSNPGGEGNNNPLAQKIHHTNNNYPVFSRGNEFKIGNHIADYHTKKVTKVNDGQITTYPYLIPEEFTIGNSHAQYYELNMEDDHISVWFCLSDDGAGSGPYSVSPNDVRNNYYIYNKKNIMYTVVGHQAIDMEYNIGAGSSYGEYEVKLFINCMIASYQAAIQGPEVVITNKDARINSSGEYIMMARTEQFESNDTDLPSKGITFKPVDTNLISPRLSARIYRYNSLGEVFLIKPEVYFKNTNNKPPATPDGEGVIVEADMEYSFDLPLGSSSDYINGMARIYIAVKNEDENLQGGAKASIIPMKLFDLD